MKKFLGILVLGLLWCGPTLSEPPVLKCTENCGKVDVNNEFSFQARLSMGPDKWGCDATFIEEDIILTAAHCLGLEIERKKHLCCDSETTKKKAKDWRQFKNQMYVVDGRHYPKKKIIVAKVLDISARVTGFSPGYDILIAHVDRKCKKCGKGIDLKIIPIPIANSLPPINTKALHVVAPDNVKKGEGRIYIDHLLNTKIKGGKNSPCSIQIIKHDGKSNPPMLFGASGSPVIFKECNNYVVHGLHGRGQDDGKYMYEHLQLLQTQKRWIQSEIYRWTGRTDMIDSCSKTGRRSFMPDQKFDIPQSGCVKKFVKEGLRTCKL